MLSGTIIKTRENRYALPEKVGLITGIVNAHPDGYAFITPEEGGVDIFIPPKKMLGAMNGDKVVVRIEGVRQGNKKREGL